MTPTRWEPGQVIDGYRLERRLGRGGMGEVFLARGVETGAAYAIKTLSDMRDAELRLRFAREGHAMVRVDQHPRVLRVHALGEAEGRAYLVLEHAPGGDLDRRLEAGPVSVAQAVAWCRDVAEGLVHLHRAGVVHRDLKPGNIMFDAEDRPKLGDFGLARLVDAQRLTATGQLLGTPAYMAPEQITGAEGVDGAADVYALGAVLYRCLTGAAPFEGGALHALLERVVSEPAPDPRQRRPDVPPALARLLARCLSKRASDRPTALELIGEFDRCSGGAGSARSRVGWPRVGAGIGFLVLSGLLGLLAATAQRGDPAAQQTSPTEATPLGAGAASPRAVEDDVPPLARDASAPGEARIPFDDAFAVRCLDEDRVVVLGPRRLAIFPLRWEGEQPPPPLVVWDSPRGRFPLRTLAVDRASGWIAALVDDGRLYVGLPDGWAAPLTNEGNWVPTALTIAPGGARLAVQARQGPVVILSLDGLQELSRFQPFGSHHTRLAFLDADTILVASTNGAGTMEPTTLERWDLGRPGPAWRVGMLGATTALRAEPSTGRAALGLVTGDLHLILDGEAPRFEPVAERVLAVRQRFLTYVPTHGAGVQDMVFKGSALVAVAARDWVGSRVGDLLPLRDARSTWSTDPRQELKYEPGTTRFGIDVVPGSDLLIEAAADGVHFHHVDSLPD